MTLASTTGVFAVFSDRATTGGNTFATQDLAKSADLKIADGSRGANFSVSCGAYSDDLETGIISLSSVTPGQSADTSFVCLKNDGSQTVDVTTSAINVTDLDTDCTGDERIVDTTCGTDAIQTPQAGELSPLITLSMTHASCDNVNQGGSGLGALSALTDASVATLAPGDVMCVNFTLRYSPTEAEAQVAQSDTAIWRFAFDGTVPTT